MGKSQKGGAFERDLCRLFSNWWIPGRSDVFWRSSNSGGRATMRRKIGLNTFGHHGDIAATDPIGQPLIDALTIEAKRGYPKGSFLMAFDKNLMMAQQEWESFVEQAECAHKLAGSKAWMLIQRHDSRRALCFFPYAFFNALRKAGAFSEVKPPFARVFVNVRVCDTRKIVRRILAVMPLDNFMRGAKREHFLKL